MKLILLLIMILSIKLSHAQFFVPPEPQKNFGAGVMIGQPTGLNFALRRPETIYNLGLGMSLNSEPTFLVDYKLLLPKAIPALIRKSNAPITAYAGFGSYLQFETKDGNTKMAIGARAPIGIDWNLRKERMSFFVEIVPTLKIITSTNFGFMAGIGGHYYF